MNVLKFHSGHWLHDTVISLSVPLFVRVSRCVCLSVCLCLTVCVRLDVAWRRLF